MATLTRAPVQRVTSLPSSPYQGQEVIYVADAANGVEWHLRYDTNVTANSGAYKWVSVGGASLSHEVDTDEAGSNASWIDLTTVGPTITVPLAGVFVAEYGCNSYSSVTGNMGMSPSWSGHAAGFTDSVSNYASTTAVGFQAARVREITLTSASTAVKLQYLSAGAGTTNWRWRYLRIRPIRVG